MKAPAIVLLFVISITQAPCQGTDKKSQRAIISFLDFRSNEKVADIGSGNLRRIMKIASAFSTTFFTFQDIDSTRCNWKSLKKQWRKNNEINDLKRFSIVYGDTISTKLQSAGYDHVTIFSSLHEFADKHKMLQDIRRCLKSTGFLYIYEDITQDSVTLYCPNKAQYFTSGQFYKLLKSENIQIIDKRVIIEDPDLEEIIFKCTFNNPLM